MADVSALRAELVGLGLKVLRTRARAEGASAEQLDDAADADDPKAAVIELLLALSHDASDGAELRAELEALRLKELRQRARAEGFATEALDHAADSDDPKAAMVELLLGKPA